MREFFKRRLLPLVMALTVCSSLIVVPAHAETVGSGQTITVNSINTLEILQAKYNYQYKHQWDGFGDRILSSAMSTLLWLPNHELTWGTGAYNSGSITYIPIQELNKLAANLDRHRNRGVFETVFIGAICVEPYYDTGSYAIGFHVKPGGLLGDADGHTQYDKDGNPVGLVVLWLCDPDSGNILLANESISNGELEDGSAENDVVSNSDNLLGSWVSDVEAMKSKTYRMVGREALYNRAVELRGYLSLRNGKYYIIDYMGENIYCGNDGLPYCAWPESTSVTETIRETDVIIDSQTKVEVNVEGGSDVNLDIDELIATLPDGTKVNADNIIYNDDSQTYYINTSSGNQTEGEDGTIYNTYNYSYTYNIDYTSVTYIGQTAEYTKHYEAYYKLPDGRSSADLTAEELEQLNLAVDVLNYGRSADDVSLRSLYHFDGETTDASYWNYCTDFTWNGGASLTYMDAGTFDGALYLDENAHDFTLTLPSNLSNGDFTLQFRYYQSATLAPQTDSYIKFGEYTLLQTNGKQFLDGSGNVLCLTPIGTWNEVAFIRHSGTLYYYLNGVKVGNVANTIGFGNTVQFVFGDAQQTYKYFDELRILNFALAESGASYTPSSVPHDTNLSLVLPTDKKPIADEYWNITSSKENLFGFDFEGFLAGEGAHYDHSSTMGYGFVAFPKYFNVSGYGTISRGNTGWLFSRTSSYSSLTTNVSGQKRLTVPIAMKLGQYNRSENYNGDVTVKSYSNFITGESATNNYGTVSNAVQPYVFSLVLGDGSVCSLPFSYSATTDYYQTASFDWGQIVFCTVGSNASGNRGNTASLICIVPNDTVEVLYMELCEGTETDLIAEHVSSVTDMSPEQLQNFTLAVRSDVDVTSYQIGGVRPSLPKKGMVWALVEGGTITSLQIYNGRAWEEVDGRIWTGSRWASLASYDVKLQKDLADIVGTTTAPEYEYIYTESGFWDWWQKSWNSFTTKFFDTQSPQTPDDKHIHSYVGEILSEATCTQAGQTKYVCSGCGDSYIEATDPLDHDFEEIADTESGHVEPTGLICSHCASTDISCELNGPVAICSCNDCLYVWELQAEYEYGETLYKCRRCGEEKTDTKDDRGLFTLIGSFFADTIRWIVSKLGSLVDAFSALAQLFDDFISSVISFAGDNPALFAAAIALIPADLMTLIWFSIVSGIIMLVWKKFKG